MNSHPNTLCAHFPICIYSPVLGRVFQHSRVDNVTFGWKLWVITKQCYNIEIKRFLKR